jgi:hypothetical protein
MLTIPPVKQLTSLRAFFGYIEKGLQYAKLIGQGGDGLPPQTAGGVADGVGDE